MRVVQLTYKNMSPINVVFIINRLDIVNVMNMQYSMSSRLYVNHLYQSSYAANYMLKKFSYFFKFTTEIEVVCLD